MKTGLASDFYTALYARSMSDGAKEYERYISGTPPLILTNSVGKPLVNWSITGNTSQNSTPTPDNPIEVKGVGDKIENIVPITDKAESTRPSGITVSVLNSEIIAKGTTKSPFTEYLYRDITDVGISFDYDVVISKAEISNLSCNFCVIDNQGVKQWKNTKNFQLIAKGERLVEVYIQQNTVGRTVDCKWKVALSPVYKIPVMSKADEQETTTPIYLDTPLMADEVLRSDGTVARADGTIETVDVPQILTLEGNCVIDVDCEVQPADMSLTYKSGGKT